MWEETGLGYRDHASHPYSTTGNIVLYILIFKFLEVEKTRGFASNIKLSFKLKFLWNTFSLHSSLNMRDHVSESYSNIIVL